MPSSSPTSSAASSRRASSERQGSNASGGATPGDDSRRPSSSIDPGTALHLPLRDPRPPVGHLSRDHIPMDTARRDLPGPLLDPEGLGQISVHSLSPGRQLWAVAFGAWLVAGLYLDGWAHIARRPEAFLTPWHGVLYSGFAMSAWWTLSQVRRARARGWAGRAAVPIGYGLGLVGIAAFLSGGTADLAWHSLFGIEVGLETLLSPSHLLLFAGGLLLLTSPIRAALRTLSDSPSLGELLPGLLSVGMVTAVVTFFLMYLSPFLTTSPTPAPYRSIARAVADPVLREALADEVRIRGIASILVTSLVLLGPCLVLLRRFRLPFGSITLLLALVGLLVAGLDGFDHPEGAAVMALGGLSGDLLVRRLAPSDRRPWTLWAFGGAIPLVLWTLYFSVLAASRNLEWSVELWAGTTALSGLAGFALALVVSPPGGGRPAEPGEPRWDPRRPAG